MSEVCRAITSIAPIAVNAKKTRPTGRQKGRKPLDKELSARHRMADLRWRQNVNNGFTALKAVVQKNRNQSSEQLKTGTKAKSVVTKQKKSVYMSRIDILKNTLDIIGTKESQIENILNERKQKQMEKLAERVPIVQDSVPLNGLDKIRNVFLSFEKRYEMEVTVNQIEDKPKQTEPKPIQPKMTKLKTTQPQPIPRLVTQQQATEIVSEMPTYLVIQSPDSTNSTSTNQEVTVKTYDPLLTSDIKDVNPVEICIEIGAEPLPDISQPVGQWLEEFIRTESVVAVDSPSLIAGQPEVDVNNNLYYSFITDQNDNYSLTPVPNASFAVPKTEAEEYYETVVIDPKNFITTDLTEHLAVNIPVSPFASLDCWNDSYSL